MAARTADCRKPPAKVTVTATGNLDPTASFFSSPPGSARKLVYTSNSAFGKASERLSGSATVIDAGDPASLPAILADLAARSISRLMVEGGATIHNQFLTAGLADELHLVIAPFFIATPPRPASPATAPSRTRPQTRWNSPKSYA